MKQQSRRSSRQKTAQKRKRTKKQKSQKQVDNLNQTIDQFTIHFSQIIGEGTYGKVYKASRFNSDETYACKFIKKDRIDDLEIYYHDKKVAQQLQDRLHTQGQFQMKLSNCPYIAKMYKTEKNQKGFYFIMEYCETDLAKLLKKEGFLLEEVALKYFQQTIEGIKYIYEKNAFHRDLKPQNLLLKNDTIKISDFGFVKIFDDIEKQCKSRRNRFQTQSKVGTFRYMSPDILALLQAQMKESKIKSNLEIESESKVQDQGIQSRTTIQSKYDPQKSDVWSLGIILYKMLYGKEPYDGKSFQEMIKKIKETKLDFPGSIEFPPGKIVKIKVSKDVVKLIKRMLISDQNERIDFMKLYSKLNSILQEKQKEKVKSGISKNQETSPKLNSNQEPSRNKKQRLLNVYNKIMVRIYKDLSNFATLREIGIENYSEFSYKIMTLLHQKRTSFLQNQTQKNIEQTHQIKKNSQQDIDQKVKQQISQYHNLFYQQIKLLANLKADENLKVLLLIVYKKIQNYEDFQLLIKDVQLFLLFLLQLCCLEMGIIKEDYICATQDKAQSLKTNSILNLKNDAVKLISDKFNAKHTQTSKEKSIPKQAPVKQILKQASVKAEKNGQRDSKQKTKQRVQSRSKTTKQFQKERKQRDKSRKKSSDQKK